ncbi:ATP-binding cassette domain-containing protein [Sphingomonas sp. PP-CE-3A-406]|uniref:ATP-binding cassette domain-containing protein n=1 Tax=Sphingomonas sp. PP-CE-3A-406 TaxID=2135659 RepID=UPI00217ED7AC|nr:ATP-binding cassette domain-containing protein [Sphingomonas sp. PP-CE-3A-406]
MFGLLGPNEAVKSTLMRIVSTLQLPTCGSVAFEGTDVLEKPGALRWTLGYLPQEFGVYPTLVVHRPDAMLPLPPARLPG